jgi:HK97 family phage major capsid protein/HK97 family phage prohead protease
MSQLFKPGTRETRFCSFTRAIDRKARTVELSFSSETPVERSWGTEILDHGKKSVRLGRLRTGGPLLVDHDARDIVGVIESVRVDADLTGRAVVRFGKSARAEEVFQDVQDGIRSNVSVAYIIYDAVEEKTKDSSLPTLRITDWEPYEISLVSVPADTAVGVGRDLRASSFTDKEQHMQDQLQAERQRTNDILTIGRDYGAAELAARAVQEGTSLADFQRQVLESRKTATIHFKSQSYGQGARSHDNIADDPKLGFRNMGHFCADVIQACKRGGNISDTLTRAASIFASESSGPDGGYDLPPGFAGEIANIAYTEESLLKLANTMPVSGNSMSFPGDETSPWGSSGIIAAWEGEGNQSDPKKPLLKHGELRLKKLKVLVAASDEVMQDAPNMSSYLMDTMGEAVSWKVQDGIMNGTGSGMPLGILKAGSLIVQAKESGQATDTVLAANIAKMYSRLVIGPRANVVWLMNPDVFPQIITLTLNSNPIWIPANQGIQNAPNGLLLGRPIILTDACQSLGDQGDIVLANMRGYRAISKDAGPQLSHSMHLWFDQDIQAFKLVFRMDGGPQLSAPITPPYSTSTRSHFVALQAR